MAHRLVKMFSTPSPFVYQEGAIWLQGGKKKRKREEHFPFYLGTVGGQPFHLTCLDLYSNMSTLEHLQDFSFFKLQPRHSHPDLRVELAGSHLHQGWFPAQVLQWSRSEMKRASRAFLKQQPHSSRILSQLCHQIF